MQRAWPERPGRRPRAGDVSEPEQRAAQGLLHLQGAAVQLIAAARAFLDVAEDLVQDPAAAASVVQTLGALAGAARAEWAGAPRASAQPPAPEAGDPPARVTRIPLSDDGGG